MPRQQHGPIHLTSFQTDGLWRAKRILAERNRVLIADEVGLDETFLAGELIPAAMSEVLPISSDGISRSALVC